MSVRPNIGEKGGQEYPVLKGIQTFLSQMAEGSARPAPMVLKELLQNADDAGATEVSVMLDQRTPRKDLSAEYATLCEPALLVRNNSHFRLGNEAGEEHDDFKAIRDVAGGHKRALATAAGRFGIGFNSVYFLTDTPVLFSRSEIHIFDLLHNIFEANGWRFPLAQYPRDSGSQAGPLKEILEWCFPRQALESASLGNLAELRQDYRQTVFRLPLRNSAEGSPALFDARFPSDEHRHRLLLEMAEESVRSIIFLKKVRKISFSILKDTRVEAENLVVVEATPCPEAFTDFLAHTDECAKQNGMSDKRSCAFDRTITRQDFVPAGAAQDSTKRWRFHLRHVTRFDDDDLHQLRTKLIRNGERATPWTAIAVPLDADACRLDGDDIAKWRVFLPLLEEGPCSCLLSGAFFVGPSRQRVEYRLNESDEGERKTKWNQLLVEKALIPLLQDISLELPEIARELLQQHPKDYLGLFPIAAEGGGETTSLTDFARRCFSGNVWVLRLLDVWGEAFDLLVGDATSDIVVELIPEWLLPYRDRFQNLSGDKRRFVRHALGNALADRVGRGGGVTVQRKVSKDVALTVLRSLEAPAKEDIEKLLELVIEPVSAASDMEGLWAFRKPEADDLLRYQAAQLHLLERPDGEAVIAHLRRLQLPFEKTEWVCADVGLPLLLEEFRPPLDNILGPTSVAALALLQRLPAANHHDVVSHHYEIKPVVDFLVAQATARLAPDLRLGFLVRTALTQADRRALGVILLKPANPAAEDEAFWDVWFRPLFAHVEPSFAQELERLLATHPEAVGTFHATDCQVAIARAHGALELLHAVRIKQPGACARMAIEIGEAAGRQRKAAERVSAFLLETADEQWEALDEAHRYTVLALPIHRCPNGQFISLLPTTAGDMAGVSSQFRLQSDDDIQDAPIETAEYQLLQTANTTVKRFYRRRLGLEIHGRVAVLKDTLRQIGEPERDNPRMLRYLEQYYLQTLTELDLSGDAIDQADARALRTVMSSARTVPCLDETWRTAQKCAEAWQMGDHLASQGWPKKGLTSLLLQLLWGKHIASIDPEIRKLLLRLHNLPGLDSRKIVELAITSECPEFNLADRVKLFCANKRDFSDRGVERSKALGQLQVPALAGPVTLAEAEFFAGSTDLPASILVRLAPNAIDLPQWSAQVVLSIQDVPPVLRAFCVQELTAQHFEARLIEQFDGIWPALRDEDRRRLLRYVGTRGLTGRLAEKAARLDTVMVATQRPVWKVPTTVISPHWNNSKPPHVAGESKPVTEAIPETVLSVWNEWCGVRTFDGVFALIMDGAAAQPGAEKRNAAKAVYNWLEKKFGVSPDEEDLKSLRTRAWVLAERGDALEFKKPSEVLLHPGEKVLGARFWVRALPLPGFRQQELSSMAFAIKPEATASQLGEISECLVERAELEDNATVRVYELVGQLLEEMATLREQWQTIAANSSVYRAFREEERQVNSVQLFLGDTEYKEDLSTRLLCLKSGGPPPPGVIAIYRDLGVPDRPSVVQLLHALGATTAMEPNAASSYARMIRTFLKLASDTEVALEPQSLAAIRILTCAGNYEPIADCFWDATLDRQERILNEHAHLLIDNTNKLTQSFVDWLRDRHSGFLVNLRAAGEFEPADEPVPMAEAPEVSYLLSPWRQWFQQAMREGSSLCDELTRLGLALPTAAVAIIPVRKIRIRCRLRAGNVIEQSGDWEGPLALAHTQDRLYVRIEERNPEDRTIGDRFGAVDTAIAREIAILLGASAASAQLPSLVDGITATLERPSTVLKQLHESNRENSLHQYHDQVADPAFAELFEEYQRASQFTNRGKELRVELETKMFALLERGFIRARRDQIKGYGYNEFSVFAELLQNAEDAYLQRQQLGMDMPEPCGILYRYRQIEGAGRVLEIEHQGRPFNYWQHGPKQDRNFTKDVEGVLRSAGSFKPHSGGASGQSSATAAIGRFGLGFKSVYLITDCPEVYSGDWHFAIESGCLPKELSPPVDLPPTATRIRLPLRDEAEDFKDASQHLGLLPFLRMTKQLIFQPLNGEATTMSVEIQTLDCGEGTVVEQVHLTAPGALRGDSVRLVRCRSSAHAGQLAFLVTQDGIPARWDEVFQQDLYAALPLQAKLGCGAAASHRFEVQSGRTHLVDPKANAAKITEVTALLGGLVDGLCKVASGGPPLSEVLRRFWSTWQWERGDGECDALRRSLAAELTELAKRKALVPTLDHGHPISLGSGPCFYFNEIPDDFRTAIVEAGVTITAGGHSVTTLAPKNVVLEGFATAYRRACDYAGLKVAKSLAGIGWAEVAAAFRERAWFAENPTLLNRLAGCMSEDQSRKAGEWIALCKVLVEGGEQSKNYLLPCDLLMADFAGKKHLPRRFLRCLSAVYHKSSVCLLGFAGLRPCPSANDIREWIQTKNFSEAEALGILAFLAEESRFMGYRELAEVFRMAWFPTNGQRLNTKQASDKRLIPEAILEDEVFRAWLGLTDQVDEPEPEPPPPLDPKDVLARLFDWWQEEGLAWTQRYERRLYPTGRLPSIQETFCAKDLGDRREWLTLLLLASLHTIGRTRLEQHRNFLSRCDEKGWLDVFAAGDYDARRWMEVIENYLEDPAGSHDYYQWMKQFVVMFQISRWLPEYVESFLQINRRRASFALDAITAPRTDAANSGGGPDAPALTRALGFGVCFVLRELTRLGILQQELAHRHCYVPAGRVCEVLEAIGCPDLRSLPATIRSSAIHKFLVENMEEGRATFGLSFDLPLLALDEDVELQRKLCGRPLLPEDNGTASASQDEGWRTLPDGRRIKLW